MRLDDDDPAGVVLRRKALAIMIEYRRLAHQGIDLLSWDS